MISLLLVGLVVHRVILNMAEIICKTVLLYWFIDWFNRTDQYFNTIVNSEIF